MENSIDDKTLNDQVREIWDANASFWSERMGEGNLFHLQLLEPTILNLLELQPDQRVLEIACGNGQLARKLASLGAQVVATDLSPNMIEQAAARSNEFADRLTFRVVDATNEAELHALSTNAFDAVVCNMAIMDMSEIDPLLSSIAHLLKPHGRFIYSICHPCFNSIYTRFNAEMKDEEGEIIETRTLRLDGYMTAKPGKGLAMIGQPRIQYYFHRPLHELFNAAFRAGLVLDGLEEKNFSPEISQPRWAAWTNFHEFPPALITRWRVASLD